MHRVVALYCRLSPRPDGSYEGVDLQERWGRRYAAKTWPGVPIEVFADRGISASNGDHRPDYERLRTWLADDRVGHVWAVEQTRLTRRETEWFELAAELDAAGVEELHTDRDGIVRVRDEVGGIKAVLAAAEARRLKRRVNDRLAEIAADGRPSGSTVFGYRRGLDEQGKKTLHQEPREADAIRWAAGRVLAGWSAASVVAELKARGFKGAHGGELTPRSVRDMLTRPTVAGLRVHRGEIVGRGVWEPILDMQTWEACRARLGSGHVVRRVDGREHQIHRPSRSRAGRRYVLTGGLAVCAECGHALTGTVKQQGRTNRHGERPPDKPYLMCPRQRGGCGKVAILLGPTEDLVADELFTELDRPEFLDAIADDKHEARRGELLAELDEIERTRRELMLDRTRRRITAAEWEVARADLDEQENAAREKLAALPPPAATVDITGARKAWPVMTLDEKRQFVRLFVAGVVVRRATPGLRRFDGNRVRVVWASR